MSRRDKEEEERMLDKAFGRLQVDVASNEEAPKKREETELSITPTIKAISMIFAEPEGEHKESAAHFSPQARIILLTIILCCTVLAMYTIFESFIDTIILAVLSGTHPPTQAWPSSGSGSSSSVSARQQTSSSTSNESAP
jgi:hypothetical protein